MHLKTESQMCQAKAARHRSTYHVMTVTESRSVAAQGWGGQGLLAKGNKGDGNVLYLD